MYIHIYIKLEENFGKKKRKSSFYPSKTFYLIAHIYLQQASVLEASSDIRIRANRRRNCISYRSCLAAYGQTHFSRIH